MIKIAICDDDINIIKELNRIITDYGKINNYEFHIKTFNKGIEIENELNRTNFDIIFLDIELNDRLGIDIGYNLREKNNNYKTKIIYISSYTQYAISAYKTMPTDFICKPLKKEEIEKSISNVLKILELTQKTFTYSNNGIVNKILLTNILYFESFKNTIKICTLNKEEHQFYSTLKEVIKKVDSQNFIHQHRCYLVNIEYILKIEKNFTILCNNDSIPISRDKIKILKEMILNYERSLR